MRNALPRLEFPRGAGHTTAMLEGAKRTKGVVIVAHTVRYAEELARQCEDASGVGIDNIERALLGARRPILIDHYALELLLRERDLYIASREVALEEAGTEIELLERENKKLTGRIAELEAVVGAAQFALDFHAMPTREFVKKYGAGATTRDVAARLREALAAAGYGEE